MGLKLWQYQIRQKDTEQSGVVCSDTDAVWSIYQIHLSRFLPGQWLSTKSEIRKLRSEEFSQMLRDSRTILKTPWTWWLQAGKMRSGLFLPASSYGWSPGVGLAIKCQAVKLDCLFSSADSVSQLCHIVTFAIFPLKNDSKSFSSPVSSLIHQYFLLQFEPI